MKKKTQVELRRAARAAFFYNRPIHRAVFDRNDPAHRMEQALCDAGEDVKDPALKSVLDALRVKLATARHARYQADGIYTIAIREACEILGVAIPSR